MREREVKSLYQPIEDALKESDEPGQLQTRIKQILENQRRYKESQQKTIEADRQETEANERPFMEMVMETMERNYSNSKFGAQELADAIGINRAVLSKKLNAETGLPTSQFIRNYRLDKEKFFPISKKIVIVNAVAVSVVAIVVGCTNLVVEHPC